MNGGEREVDGREGEMEGGSGKRGFVWRGGGGREDESVGGEVEEVKKEVEEDNV